jgi:polar amino acid transport system ATP-binding protein
MQEPIIKLKRVFKKVGDANILDGIDLSIPATEMVAVIGPSGSGKSTLLRLLMGLDRPTSGDIEIDGEAMWLDTASGDKKNMEHMRRIRSKIGMVFQQFNLFPHFSALENVMEAPMQVLKMERKLARQRAEEYLELVGLGDKMDAYPARLSGGQKQRVAIARALAMRPKIMLFDEITSALDPELVGGVLNIVQSLAAKREMTMILVTHHMNFAERCADRVLFIDQGQIIEDGEAKQIFRQPSHERTRHFLDALIDHHEQ